MAMRLTGSWWCAALALAAGGARAEDEVAPRYPAAGVAQGGAVGVGHLASADPGDPGALRLALRGGFFQGGNFPVAGSTRQLLGELTAGYTLTPALELFGAYRNSSSANETGYPALIQAQGDLLLGAKAGLAFGDLRVAGDLRFDLRNGVGADAPALDASSVQLRALGSWATKAGEGRLVVHANAGAILGASGDAANMDALQVFGTGLSAYHRLVAGVGAQYEFGRITPYLGFDLDQPLGVGAAALAGAGAFEAAAKRFSLGARILAGPAGAFDVQLDLASGAGAQGFARAAPYVLSAAYSFAFDAELYAPPPPPPPPPAPTRGAISGTVALLDGEAPIANAIVTVEGADLPPVATDASGRFTTLDLPPGPVTLRVEREGYKPTTWEARVAAGRAAPVQIHLEAIPPPPPPPAPPPPPPPPPAKGYLAGKVDTGTDRASARITIHGPVSEEIRTGTDGAFSVKVPPGTYDLVLAPDAFYARSAQVVVESEQVAVVIVKTAPMAAKRVVSVTGDEVIVTQPLVLDERSPAPAADAEPVLNELVDLLVRNPARRLILAVHADPPRKGADDRKLWTEVRAQALRKALLARGAPADRLEAKGQGMEQPIVPPKAKDQTKNRRVEFRLERYAEQPPTPAETETAPLAPADEPFDLPLTLPVP